MQIYKADAFTGSEKKIITDELWKWFILRIFLEQSLLSVLTDSINRENPPGVLF